MDFKTLNQAAVTRLPFIISYLGLQGRNEGRWFVALNPRRADTRLGSFKINLDTGYWRDYATHDAYGDVIGLVAYIKHLSQYEAAEIISSIINGKRRGEM